MTDQRQKNTGDREMKPKNFPARKLFRQMRAQGIDPTSQESAKLLEQARAVRTKKRR